MKTLFLIPAALTLCSFTWLTDYAFVDKDHCFHLEGRYRYAGSADFRSHGFKHTHLRYSDAYGYAYLSHKVGNDKNFLSLQLGDTYFNADWKQNPRFTGTNYNYAVGSLAWITTSLDRWRWVFRGGATVDTKHFNFGRTGVYHGFVWGRYAFKEDFGVHIGFYGHWGIKNHYELPVIGFDWLFAKKWKLNAVFPLDLSMEYYFANHWCAKLQATSFGGPYRYPKRAHHGINGFQGAIFELFAPGTDLTIKYTYSPNFFASLGGGWNFGGWMLIKDSHNHRGSYFKYNGSPYGVATIGSSF